MAGLAGCTLADITAPGALVPPTADENPFLPQLSVNVAARARRLHLQTFGDPAAPAALVLPGGPGDDFRLVRPLQALSDRYFVAMWDPRGAGLSERVSAAEITLDSLNDQIAAVHAALAPGQPVTLIGHSFGGLRALRFAATHPDEVAQLALLAPGPIDAEGRSHYRGGRINPTARGCAHLHLLRAGARVRDLALRGLPPSRVALEPALVFSQDYTYTLVPPGARYGFQVGGGVKVPTTLLSSGAWRVHLIGSAYWLPADRWGVALGSLWYLVRNENRTGELLGLGVELRATPGYVGPRWMAALDFGWQGALLTRIRHSELSRAAFEGLYPPGVNGPEEPVDGWYGPTAHRFRLGLAGGYRLTDRTVLQLALGSLFVLQKQGVLLGFDFAQIPIYLEASLRLGW